MRLNDSLVNGYPPARIHLLACCGVECARRWWSSWTRPKVSLPSPAQRSTELNTLCDLQPTGMRDKGNPKRKWCGAFPDSKITHQPWLFFRMSWCADLECPGGEKSTALSTIRVRVCTTKTRGQSPKPVRTAGNAHLSLHSTSMTRLTTDTHRQATRSMPAARQQPRLQHSPLALCRHCAPRVKKPNWMAPGGKVARWCGATCMPCCCTLCMCTTRRPSAIFVPATDISHR